MLKKYGPQALNDHFLSFNTICDATQERQDAMFDLVEQKLDLMVVIGGYNSSNTTHLQEIAIERSIPSYHIDSAARIGPDNRIEHKLLHGDLTVTANWLPDGPITVGITSGASTPGSVGGGNHRADFRHQSKYGAGLEQGGNGDKNTPRGITRCPPAALI